MRHTHFPVHLGRWPNMSMGDEEEDGVLVERAVSLMRPNASPSETLCPRESV